VVDTFISAYPEMVDLADAASNQARTLVVPHVEPSSSSENALEEIRAVAADSAALASTRQRIADARGPVDVLNVIGQGVRQLTPSSVCAYFGYSSDADDLTCEYVSGEQSSALLGLTMRPGERVTGWVAANRQTIRNSDATLDLGQAALVVDPRPRSTVSTPVLGPQGELYGVLTAYSPGLDVYSHRHVYAFEQLAEALAETISNNRVKSAKLVSFHQRHA
jgi:GAF domain-containing protein